MMCDWPKAGGLWLSADPSAFLSRLTSVGEVSIATKGRPGTLIEDLGEEEDTPAQSGFRSEPGCDEP